LTSERKGRRKKEEGRRKKEEGRRKKEEGRKNNKEQRTNYILFLYMLIIYTIYEKPKNQ
jgi:hypothetical protein